jgi:hypothetical protein
MTLNIMEKIKQIQITNLPNFTKASFWDTDISKMNKIEQGYHEPGDVIYASKLPNGTWLITWDSGEISGFNEGEDFEFIPEDEL